MVSGGTGPQIGMSTGSSSDLGGTCMKGQTWHPVLQEILIDYPRLIPPQESLLQREGHQGATEIIPQLAVWPVSGKST